MLSTNGTRIIVQVIVSFVIVYMLFFIFDITRVNTAVEDAKTTNTNRAEENSQTDPVPHGGVIELSAQRSELGVGRGNIKWDLKMNIEEMMSLLDNQMAIVDSREYTDEPVPELVKILNHDQHICADPPKWLVIIFSHRDNSKQRDLLRSTWANNRMFLKFQVSFVFLIASSTYGEVKEPQDTLAIDKWLSKEQTWHNDLIIVDVVAHRLDYVETYKVMLFWIQSYCKKAQYILKVDEFSYVDLLKLKTQFEVQSKNKPRTLYCNVVQKNQVKIIRDSKKCEVDEYCSNFSGFPGLSYFPKHCDQMGFAFTGEMAAKLWERAQVAPGFHMGNIWLTTILTHKIPMTEYLDLSKAYSLIPNRSYKDIVEAKVRRYVIAKIQNPIQMKAMFKFMLTDLTVSQVESLSETYRIDFSSSIKVRPETKADVIALEFIK